MHRIFKEDGSHDAAYDASTYATLEDALAVVRGDWHSGHFGTRVHADWRFIEVVRESDDASLIVLAPCPLCGAPAQVTAHGACEHDWLAGWHA